VEWQQSSAPPPFFWGATSRCLSCSLIERRVVGGMTAGSIVSGRGHPSPRWATGRGISAGIPIRRTRRAGQPRQSSVRGKVSRSSPDECDQERAGMISVRARNERSEHHHEPENSPRNREPGRMRRGISQPWKVRARYRLGGRAARPWSWPGSTRPSLPASDSAGRAAGSH